MPLRVPARAARGRFLTEGRRKLAAVMFTDMVGYTLLGQKNEQLSVALAREQRRLIRPLLARHGGREVKTMGDSFLVVFTNALDAVRCAYDIQRAVREFNFSVAGETQIHLRIGVHLGDVVEARGDIAGDAVNLASRVEGQAADGGVCLTQQVYDQVLNKFELPLVSMGARSLKNVVRPVELYSVEMPWTRAAPTPAAAPSRQRIAILPFANFSPDPGDDYFADGMTDEIISKVSGISGLSVISRTSAMGYKGTSKNVKVIGQELEVGSILEGSLRKVGNRIRVAAQLIDVTGDRHVWSQNYEKELDDVFAVQSDVAQKIAESMEVSLLESERTNIRRIPTKSLSAYESYLQGLYLFNKGRSASVQASIECLEGAIRLDPKFSQAYAALGNIYVASAGEQMPLREAFAKAEQMIAAALRLDPDCSDAHLARGNLALQYHLDWQMAEWEFSRAIELNPNNAMAHSWMSVFSSVTGDAEGALKEGRRAQELDPLSLVVQRGLSRCLVLRHDYQEAIALWQRAVRLEPENAFAHIQLADLYGHSGEMTKAAEELGHARRLKMDGDEAVMLVPIYSLLGDLDAARRLLTEIRAGPRAKDVSPTRLAAAHMALGEKAKALEAIEGCFEEERGSFLFCYQDPVFDPLRADPRFASLVSKLNIPRRPAY